MFALKACVTPQVAVLAQPATSITGPAVDPNPSLWLKPGVPHLEPPSALRYEDPSWPSGAVPGADLANHNDPGAGLPRKGGS